jgi:hypothetical protein
VVRTVVDSGTTSPPTCDEQGFTGETNNLTLTSTAIPPPENAPVYLMASHLPVLPGHPASPFGPSLVFTESNADGVVQVDCADALTIGDTHLTTFSGLHYDFQASGDFVLLDSSGFSVHVRQVSGAPTWPNTAINKAIVAQMDGTRVEIYVEPEPWPTTSLSCPPRECRWCTTAASTTLPAPAATRCGQRCTASSST